jgi:hypothetical protein
MKPSDYSGINVNCKDNDPFLLNWLALFACIVNPKLSALRSLNIMGLMRIQPLGSAQQNSRLCGTIQ